MPDNFGWIENPEASDAVEAMMGVFGSAADFLTGSGKGKIVCLHESFPKIGEEFCYTDQGPVGSCFPAGQQVLLSDGTEKNIEDIVVGDEVVTHLNNHKKVTNTFSRLYSGKIYSTKANKTRREILSTACHKFFTSNGLQRIDSVDNNLQIQKTNTANLDLKTIDLMCLDENLILVTDTKVRVGNSDKIINRYIEYDDDICWLLGLYAAEGGCEKSRHDKYSRLTFSIHVDEIVTSNRIHKIIKDKFDLGCSESFKKNSKCKNIRCVSEIVCKFFLYHVTGKCTNKDISNQIHLFGNSSKTAFLKGYIDGDGHYLKKHHKIDCVTASYNLALSISRLFLSVECLPSFGIRKARKQSKQSYSVCIYGSDCLKFYNLETKTNNKREENACCFYLPIYEQNIIETINCEVYCIEVEDDHSFVCNGYAVSNCVAASKAGQIDVLKATEIANGERELYVNETAIEPIYYGARVVIGKNRLRGDGAVSAYAAQYVNQYGTLVKKKYGNIDLTEYSPERCRKWGSNSGFPKTLEEISKDNIVLTIARVKSWEELRDSIANGFPVSVGSRLGFSSETDDEGFCKHVTTWGHDMYYCAVDDDSKRKGALCVNSWGRRWLKIRKRKLNQPDGTFWVDAEKVDEHMRNGDAWSISGFQGFKRPIDSTISW